MGRGLKSGTILALFLLGAIWGSSEAWAGDFRPWWDFRQWGMVAAPPERARIYLDYMDQFQRQGITVLMLNNPKSLPPFTPEQRFLADAAKRGIKVWLRTNRVSPKGGIPGVPNTTLDFALNPDIQKQTLDYLLAMAKLSTEFPNVVGLIIGG
ncbi:MAG: hypothetical protein HY743_12640, partial [Deltaproteobacteria bacterium]|nr:hypothetical protein [Deltaproteobacteria bacterium]